VIERDSGEREGGRASVGGASATMTFSSLGLLGWLPEVALPTIQ
jgi:hypothetical protein